MTLLQETSFTRCLPGISELNVETRWDETRKLRLCILCLKGNHEFKE